jgi:cardiolipin synthase C
MRRLSVSFLVLVLGACSLSPERRAEIDALVEQQRGSVTLVPHASSVALNSQLDSLVLDDGRHHLLLIEQGSDALAMRIHLIRSAHERIELMNYIFHDDESGQLLLAELVDAARRGVSVRVLVDSLFSLDDVEMLAGLELLEAGIEVSFYNPLFDRASLGNLAFASAVICCFRQLNNRLHHKLLAIDGRHGMVGGRNSADRYFDLDTRMNFLDIEVVVSGGVVAEMSADFDRFWQHAASVPARYTRDVAKVLEKRRPAAIVLERDNRAAYAFDMVESPQWLDHLLSEAGFHVGEVRYFSDPPDKTWHLESEVSTRVLHELIAGARERVLIQTPYFVLSRNFERLLAELDESVEVVVSTNSLASTDAWPVYAISRRQRYRMVNGLGVRLFEAKPFPADLELFNRRYEQLVIDRALGITSPMRIDPPSATAERPGPRISVHAKLLVIDDRIAVVTSHNFDPRSERFNTENGILVEDETFARALSDYIETILAPRNSWLVAARPAGPPLIGPINRGMARVSRRLPTLDLWPWYLTENYRVDQGATAVGPRHPEFHEHHEAVGLMPEVVLLRRIFSTGLVSRMFGFLRPIM